MYLPDTNLFAAILRGKRPDLTARLRSLMPSEVGLSSIVAAELHYGAWRSGRAAENLALIRELTDTLVRVPFDDRCAAEYGVIRADLVRLGQTIGPNDLMIAATARAHDATLVTHNRAEFGRVVGLRIDDWEGPP